MLKRSLLPISIILLACIGAYTSAFDNGFLDNWDDLLYVTKNKDVWGFSVENIRSVFTSFYGGNYAPVQMISYMFDYELWGLDPFGFILHNILLHGANGVLLYLVLRQLSFSSTNALAGALLFILHPVQVESVAWVSQRKNLVSMFFFLQSLLCYVAYTNNAKRERLLFSWSCIAFLLALLAKSVVVVLPVILVAYDLLMRERKRSLTVMALEKIPYGLLAVAIAALTIYTQDPSAGGGIAKTYHGGSGFATFFTMLTVYRDYLVNLLWPFGLSTFYAPLIRTTIDPVVIACGVLLLGSFFLPLLLPREVRKTGWFWVIVFIVSLLPVSQIVPLITLMNDRYLYFPMLGFGGLFATVGHIFEARRFVGVKYLLLMVPLLLSVFTFQRADQWSDSITLWTDATEKVPEASQSWALLAHSYHQSGDNQKAAKLYREALKVDPLDWTNHYELGFVLEKIDDYENAIEAFRNGLAIEPDHFDALYHLGFVYIKDGQYDQALPVLSHALRLRPSHANTVLLLGHGYYCLGKYDLARIMYQRILRQIGNVPAVWNYLGLLELRQGRSDKSRDFTEKAMQFGGNPAEMMLDRVRLDSLARRTADAMTELRMALNLGVPLETVQQDLGLKFLRDTAEYQQFVRSR